MSSTNLWTELCKDIPYSPAYAISHLLDPTIFYFFNENSTDTSKLTIYLIYDSTLDNEKLLIFDNGVGYGKEDLEQIVDFQHLKAKGWKQWVRAIQWISNGAKIYSKKIEDSETYQLVLSTINNDLIVDPLKAYGAKEFISRTKFGSGSLLQLKISKKWNILEYSQIVAHVNRIFQKYVNLDKIEFKAVYRINNKFYDCSRLDVQPEIETYRKALALNPIQKPKLFVSESNTKGYITIDESINFSNYKIGIKGFVGILDKPNSDISGIYCFNANKLVRGALTNTSLKPKEIFGSLGNIEYSSIYGELEFNNIPLSITGDNFILTEEEYETIVNLLISIIGKQGDTKEVNKITTQINTEYATTNILNSKTIEQNFDNSEENVETIAESMQNTKTIIDLQVETVKRNKKETNIYSIKDEYGKDYKIQLIPANNKETSGCWIKKKYGNDGLIIVYLNQEHPFLKPIVANSKRTYNTFCEFVIYYIMAEERALIEGAGVDELKFLIDNYLRKGN
ncbi:hypothetical protein [Mycoplasmoides alvi]|uniref:hypothetical protein n=1 Tax=Mycoplasmoides alvi TaxID=78580 RepID=UPI00051BE2DD|nr:hypothetical protein [Mycoplasmoides alvi]